MKNDKEIKKKENIFSAVMVAISLIPVIGSALNEVLFDRRGRIKQERINSLVKELEKSFTKIDEEKVDKKFLYSDEFGDVLESTFRKTSEFGTKERIKRFKNVIVNQIRIKEESSIIETYLNLITTLTEKQILLLDFYQKEKKYFQKIYEKIKQEEKRGRRGLKFEGKEVTIESADVFEIRDILKGFKEKAYEYSGINNTDDIEMPIKS